MKSSGVEKSHNVVRARHLSEIHCSLHSSCEWQIHSPKIYLLPVCWQICGHWFGRGRQRDLHKGGHRAGTHRRGHLSPCSCHDTDHPVPGNACRLLKSCTHLEVCCMGDRPWTLKRCQSKACLTLNQPIKITWISLKRITEVGNLIPGLECSKLMRIILNWRNKILSKYLTLNYNTLTVQTDCRCTLHDSAGTCSGADGDTSPFQTCTILP